MKLHIREATSSDYEAINDIFVEGDAYHARALPGFFRQGRGPARAREYIESILENSDAVILLAEADGQVVGLAHVEVRDATDYPILVRRRYAKFDSLVVKEDFRRRGVGRALVAAVHGWAKDKGATEVELNVWEFNWDARSLYESLGYETISRRMFRRLE